MSDELQEDGQTEPRRGKMSAVGDKQKFKDPLMNTALDDSDEGEVCHSVHCPNLSCLLIFSFLEKNK